MDFDKYRIAIRERSLIEILDLALHVIRAHALPLGAALAVGIVPAICLNAWLLARWTEPDFDLGYPFWYLFWMTPLVIWEIPLATAPATLFLGQALFTPKPQAGQVARDFFRSLPQMLLYQVFLRGLMIPLVFTWFVPYAIWPYLGEVILLDRNPLRARTRGGMTTWRRNRSIHSGFSGDLFSRWLGSLIVGAALLASFWLSMWLAAGLLLSAWEFRGPVFTVFFPLALWLVVGYFSVVRYLGYLDLRIRREGWEVELLMRAEGARLTRQLT